MRLLTLLTIVLLQGCARFHERAEVEDVGSAPDAARAPRDVGAFLEVGVDAALLDAGAQDDAALVDATPSRPDAWAGLRIYGEPCTRSEECATGLTCESPFSTTPGICADRCYPSRTRCELDPDVLAWCEEARSCAEPQPHFELAACATDADCLPGLFCDAFFCSRTPVYVPGLCDAEWAAYWPAPPGRSQEEDTRLFAVFETCMRDLERR